MATRKLNSTLPADLVERMDAYREKSGLSRSGIITVAVKQYLDAQELLPDVTDALRMFSKLMDSAVRGEASEADITKLEGRMDEIEAYCKAADLPLIQEE